MYTKNEIFLISRERAAECRQHTKVNWYCFCGNKKTTDNQATSVKCGCGKWMQWSYPAKQEVA
jgi:hypothetical protein